MVETVAAPTGPVNLGLGASFRISSALERDSNIRAGCASAPREVHWLFRVTAAVSSLAAVLLSCGSGICQSATSTSVLARCKDEPVDRFDGHAAAYSTPLRTSRPVAHALSCGGDGRLEPRPVGGGTLGVRRRAANAAARAAQRWAHARWPAGSRAGRAVFAAARSPSRCSSWASPACRSRPSGSPRGPPRRPCRLRAQSDYSDVILPVRDLPPRQTTNPR